MDKKMVLGGGAVRSGISDWYNDKARDLFAAFAFAAATLRSDVIYPTVPEAEYRI